MPILFITYGKDGFLSVSTRIRLSTTLSRNACADKLSQLGRRFANLGTDEVIYHIAVCCEGCHPETSKL